MITKRSALLTAMALVFPIMASGAESRHLSLSPRITSVTVYPDRAMTKRSATVEVKPGSYLIGLDSLPVMLQEDSVRVEGRGSAVATITGIEVKPAFLEAIPEKRAKELEDEIFALQRKMASLDARKNGLAAQKNFVESIRLAWGDRISKELAIGKPTTAEMNEVLGFIGTGITSIEEKGQDLETEKKQIKDRIEALNLQLEASRGSARKEAKMVEVAIDVTKEGKLALTLSCVVPRANWEPAYDARLSADGKTTELTFRGQVQQQTGEDWTDVDLYLSTARPVVGGVPPQMPPWRLSFYRPMPAAPVMAAPAPHRATKSAMAMKEETAAYGAAPEAELDTAYQTAEVGEEQTSMLFHIPRQVDIPSDGTRHATTVAIEKLPVTLEYVAVPKFSPYAYLRSEIVNKTAYPILPGKVNIFTGGNFIGSSYLGKVPAGDKFELFYGIDDQLTVKREELKRHKEGGLFGGNRQTYSYRIEAANFRKEPQTITIRDQMPVSADDEIKVSLEEPSVKPDEMKGDGTLIWKLQVAPGGKREISYGIKVEYPKDKEVSGL